MDIEVEKQNSPETVELGIMNAGSPAELYSKIPCTVGYSYIRFEVGGSIRACCIAKHSIGDLSENSWREVWRSTAYHTFRSKMMRIHKERFHLEDPEYFFCQQCSHSCQNTENARRLGLLSEEQRQAINAGISSI